MNERKVNRLRSVVFGEYLPDHFFFKIYTNEPRPANFDQQLFQRKHQFTLLHEYTHYLHEVSTQVGTISLVYGIGFRAILNRYVTKDLTSSDFERSMSKADLERLDAILDSLDIILGGTFEGVRNPVRAIVSYRRVREVLMVPNGPEMQEIPIEIPVLNIQNGRQMKQIKFNKFFIYEGIAYELEQVHAAKRGVYKEDDADGTEYTMLRYFGEHLMPGISRYALLTLAAFSLVYINCGTMFETLVRALAIEFERTQDERAFLERTRENIRQEYRDLSEGLESVLQEAEEAYRYRSALSSTFDSLKIIYQNAAKKREGNPAFEIDYIYNNQFEDLLEAVPPCDYVVVYNDQDEFMRDRAGTTRAKEPNGIELAKDYQAFACHIHYSQIMLQRVAGEVAEADIDEEDTRCPYYTACDLKYRVDSAEICRRMPRLTFDLSAASDNQYCSYGQGVQLTKGLDQQPDEGFLRRS